MTVTTMGSERHPDQDQEDYNDAIRLRRWIDDRREVTDPIVGTEARVFAESVCAVVPVSRMAQRYDRRWVLAAPAFADMYNLDESEPFREQPVAAVGTAFLVASNVVATALHVARRIENGESIHFVFGYRVQDRQTRTVFEVDDIYVGRDVFSIRQRTDTALIRLDRDVAGRSPLLLRLDAPLMEGEPIYVIGHPAGLPAKYAGNARAVPNDDPDFFSANLDVMICNSGSPVFSRDHHDVVGVASRGPVGFITFNQRLVTSMERRDDYAVVISRIANLIR